MCRFFIVYFIYMFGVMLILLYYVYIVLMLVDEQATVDPKVQQIEVAEQDLIEGKLCP
jgi:hypothetical protein